MGSTIPVISNLSVPFGVLMYDQDGDAILTSDVSSMVATIQRPDTTQVTGITPTASSSVDNLVLIQLTSAIVTVGGTYSGFIVLTMKDGTVSANVPRFSFEAAVP